MEILSFNDLQKQMQELIRAGDYDTALNLVTDQTNNFPEHTAQLGYWRIAMAALNSQPELALQHLEVILSTGFWYNEALLNKSPSLRTLQELPEFQALLEVNRRQREADHSHSFPLITLRNQGGCQSADLPCPLLLALHNTGSNAHASLPLWQPAASAGWLVGVVQSSQAMWKDAYHWEDRQVAEQEIQRNHAALVKNYAVDPGTLVLAGLESGGDLAIHLALSGILPISGFLAIGLQGNLEDEINQWLEQLQVKSRRNLRGYLIIPEDDLSIPNVTIEKMLERFSQLGIPCEFEQTPGSSGDFPPEYGDSLLRGLDFIISGQ